MRLEAGHEVLEVRLIGLPVTVQETHSQVLHDVPERGDASTHRTRHPTQTQSSPSSRRRSQPLGRTSAAVVLRLVQLVHIARQDHLEIGDEESQETEIDALHVKRGVSTNHQVRFAVAADSVSDQWPDQRQNTEIDYLQRHRKHCPQSEDNKPKLLSLRPSFLCSVRVQNSCIRFPGKKRMGISCTVRGVAKREW